MFSKAVEHRVPGGHYSEGMFSMAVVYRGYRYHYQSTGFLGVIILRECLVRLLYVGGYRYYQSTGSLGVIICSLFR